MVLPCKHELHTICAGKWFRMGNSMAFNFRTLFASFCLVTYGMRCLCLGGACPLCREQVAAPLHLCGQPPDPVSSEDLHELLEFLSTPVLLFLVCLFFQ